MLSKSRADAAGAPAVGSCKNAPMFQRVVWMLLVVSAGLSAQTAAQEPRFDIVIRGGTVLDGTGGAPFRADVGIIGKYIARIGDLTSADAPTFIDANGLYVTPGFINIHSHAIPAALSTAENMLTQGVTLEILNPDGFGSLNIKKQLTDIATRGLAVNIGANIGFNSAWATVVGEADRRPTADDITKMRQMLVSNLAQGAWGVSAGLDYKPAYFASTEEIVDIVRAASRWRTIFTNHERLTSESNYSSRVGMTETMVVGARAGLIPVITHMKLQGREQGTAAAFLKTMTDTTAQGRYVAADVYPYLAGETSLVALIIPRWAQDGGRHNMLERFKDPALRAKIVAESGAAMAARFGGPDAVYMPAQKRGIADVMKELGVSGGEAVVRVLEQGDPGIIARFGLEDDLVKILQHPTTSIACDCGAVRRSMATHPRYYGTFPRVLGHYVRETGAVTWPDAIRKMTLLPAATIGLVDRGMIAAGMAADITIFDPAKVSDHATFEQPTLQSNGIRHVIVGGKHALQDGTVTGSQGGEALFRDRRMPSRPLDMARARRLTVKMPPVDRNTGLWFDIDVAQTAGVPRASGKLNAVSPILRVVGRAEPAPEVRSSYEAIEIGILQMTNNWATLTVRARVVGGRTLERNILIIVEGADPWLSGEPPSVTMWEEGMPAPMTVRLEPGMVRIQ